jgi:D-glycero-alpha-D-manno-heptose 1-phosphate guanylyltransferase
MTRTAVILAGGFGTRLQAIVKEVPKPMADVSGEPFLTYQLRYLHHFGFENVIFSVGYLSEKIRAYYGDKFRNMKLGYALEHSPLGTGGGIRLALGMADEKQCLVLNGDSFFDIDLRGFYTLHRERKSDVSLALREVNDASRFGTIATDEHNRVVSFKEKENQNIPGIINAGVYIIDREIFLGNTPANKSFSIEKEFFQPFSATLKLCGFKFSGYFIDIGIPEDYVKAQDDFKGFKYQ